MLRNWFDYPLDFRGSEVQKIASWVMRGKSGCIVGLPGIGKSNLLQFVCKRPESIKRFLPQSIEAYFVQVDLNDLPSNDVSVFYRTIIRSIYLAKDQLNSETQNSLLKLYGEAKCSNDPFVAQSALLEISEAILNDHDVRLILVFDKFDQFCKTAPIQLVNSLRGLRDKFKGGLIFLMGMRQHAQYLEHKENLGDLYTILDNQHVWIGHLKKKDANMIIRQEIMSQSSVEDIHDNLYSLSGGYPSLLYSLCQLIENTSPDIFKSKTTNELLSNNTISHRLNALADGLSQKEMMWLVQLAQNKAPPEGEDIWSKLCNKGLLWQNHQSRCILFHSDLIASYFLTRKLNIKGGIHWSKRDGRFYQGAKPLGDLSPLEQNLLKFLAEKPHEKHRKSALIEVTWGEEENKFGVSDESLYQAVSSLRKKIEPSPNQPIYIINWRGRPEGGYQFYPEGRPRITT